MKVTFETAALVDSIKKAAIVAPSTGAAFDKANGIVLNLDSEAKNGWHVLIKSTNLDIFRMEWVDPEEISGGQTTWRLPAKLLASVLSTLPIGTGQRVTMEDGQKGLQTFMRITCGRTKIKFNLIDHTYYPDWPIFDPSTLTQALDLGGRIGQVEWAADNGQPPWAGIHFDGEVAVATDRYRMACVPLPIPGLTEPITVPAGLLGQLLRQTGEIRLGVEGEQLLIMPDDSIQIRCVLYGVPFPNTKGIRERVLPNTIKVRKTPLLEMLQRAATYGASDRDGALRLFIGAEELAVQMSNQEVGVLGDAIEIPGQAVHDRFEVLFTPKNLMDPISNAPSEEVIIGYELGNPNGLVRIDGGSGYNGWGMPRKTMRPEGTA